MKVLTLLKAKENNRKATTSGAVTVIGGGKNASVDGQTISPAVVNTALLNADEIISNNITNNNNITTSYLNANTIVGNTGSFTTLSAQYMNTGDLEVNGDAIFHNGLTAEGTSNFEDIISNNITNSGLITTQDLEVLGSAHFFELIIDKIKAAGGSVLLSPADGFKVDDATIENFYVKQYSYSYAPVQEQVPVLWFKSTDGDRTIYNMWENYDQAICANFNEAKQGTNYDVSNNFWWYMVGATNNDGMNAAFTYSYAGAPVQHDIYENGELKETAECHYIALVPSIGHQSSKDLTNLAYLKAQIGNDVAMLGHNARDTRQMSSVQARRSAIYMSCYNNWLDTQLRAPLWAHYNNINDFTLGQAQRLTKFDANGGEIIGSFKVQAGGNTQNLDDYILSIAGQREANIVIQDGNNNNFDTIVLQADENELIYNLNNFPSMIRIGATYNGNMITSVSDFNSLEIELFGETIDILQGTPAPAQSGIYISNITWSPMTNTYDLTFAFAGQDYYVTNSNITISGNISAGGSNYDIDGTINVPVITSIEGTDADFYELGVVNETAEVDANGDFEYSCRYQLRHTVGTTTTYENNNQGFTLRYTVISQNGTQIEQGYAVWTDATPGYWLKTGTVQNWYSQSTKPVRIRLELIDTNNTVVDTRMVNVINRPTALFEVEDGLTRSIQAVSDTSYSYYTSLTQTTQNITSTVSALALNVNNLNSYSYLKFSEIDQRADSISLTVNTLSEGLQQTGIDITNGTITLNADNTNINGSLNVYDDDSGITILNSNGSIATQLISKSISDMGSNVNASLLCNMRSPRGEAGTTRSATYQLGYISQGTVITINQISAKMNETNLIQDFSGSFTRTLYVGGTAVSTTTASTSSSDLSALNVTNLAITQSGDYAITISSSNANPGWGSGKYMTVEFTFITTVNDYNLIGRDGILITKTGNKLFRVYNDSIDLRYGDDGIRLDNNGLRRWEYGTQSWAGFDNTKKVVRYYDYGDGLGYDLPIDVEPDSSGICDLTAGVGLYIMNLGHGRIVDTTYYIRMPRKTTIHPGYKVEIVNECYASNNKTITLMFQTYDSTPFLVSNKTEHTQYGVTGICTYSLVYTGRHWIITG